MGNCETSSHPSRIKEVGVSKRLRSCVPGSSVHSDVGLGVLPLVVVSLGLNRCPAETASSRGTVPWGTSHLGVGTVRTDRTDRDHWGGGPLRTPKRVAVTGKLNNLLTTGKGCHRPQPRSEYHDSGQTRQSKDMVVDGRSREGEDRETISSRLSGTCKR